MGRYPEKDFTAGQAWKPEVTLRRHDVSHRVKPHPGVRHSLFSLGRGADHPYAAEDSWRRTLAFYEQQMGDQS